eukprot:CAMPEP_0113972666 /NCGR_PEP_ID=MMETSP0011_2-20120614/13670_1 /TAXON_ID=101924 /ORGANISM="Rhodosorus marinus" /LENGTH=234 /DNA_ID=CAMNT_0000989801 /DNA_START=136 /DNA_END=840 /DNA_ORIENTATION=- /assembly_acc=CAM_ASM_000156
MIGFVGGVPGAKPDTQSREGVTCDGWKKRAKWKQGRDSGAVMPGTLPTEIPTLQTGAAPSTCTYSPGRSAPAAAPMDYGRSSAPMDYGRAAPLGGNVASGTSEVAKWKQGRDSGAVMPGTLPTEIPTLQTGAAPSTSTYSPGRSAPAAAPMDYGRSSAPMDYGRAAPLGGNVASGTSEVPLFELWKGVSEEIIEKMKAVKMESDRSVVQQHEEDISYLNTVKNKAASKLDSAAR